MNCALKMDAVKRVDHSGFSKVSHFAGNITIRFWIVVFKNCIVLGKKITIRLLNSDKCWDESVPINGGNKRKIPA